MHEAPRTNPVFGAFFVLFWNKSAKSRQKSKTKKTQPVVYQRIGLLYPCPEQENNFAKHPISHNTEKPAFFDFQ